MAIIDSVKLPDNSTYDVADNTSGYAKKVASATADDLASLTATGDLADSGKKISDLVLKSDTVNNLNSTSTSLPLSANMGHAIADNLAANENVCGAKNLLRNEAKSLTGNITFTVNADKSVTVNGTSSGVVQYDLQGNTYKTLAELGLKANTPYILSGGVGTGMGVRLSSGGAWPNIYAEDTEVTFTVTDPTRTYRPQIYIGSGVTLNNVTFKPMIRDARILDDTFVPFAKTNKQLTGDKAERNDLSTIHVTGNTNNSGGTIASGTYFYKDGELSKALASIAMNAALTLDTNYKTTTVGAEITPINITSQITVDTSKMTAGTLTAYRIGHLCYVFIDSAKFDADADGVSIATGFPKALVQSGVTTAGANAAQTATVMNSVAFIQTGTTTLKMHITAHATNHWISLWYICE